MVTLLLNIITCQRLTHFIASTISPSSLSPLNRILCQVVLHQTHQVKRPHQGGRENQHPLPVQRVCQGVISRIQTQNRNLTDPTANL